ncbi:hypothetical protein KO516_03725 [Citreicella sp. C3M06]|uniref:hypothetical protein n=1 Tax=Citreicella sp. C3M06 TaxID=2841564 RepID=UPI001C08A15F|nr:hypothetical protein [Citreicella sp. C3M06]MBU2959948.1 hypothetical protein [Citreicella sp. C3M06]
MLIGGVFGFITMELAPHGRPGSTNWGPAFDSALDALPPEQFPECVRAMPQMKNRTFWRALVQWHRGSLSQRL